MPFGLMNVLSTFQRLMQNVLYDLEDFSLPYIDDILIWTWNEHVTHLRRVLERLREHGLTAKPEKCVWAAEELDAATELECLAVVNSICHFEVYLHGKPFTSLRESPNIQSPKSTSYVVGSISTRRWALFLQEFDMTIWYHPGKENSNADGLSR